MRVLDCKACVPLITLFHPANSTNVLSSSESTRTVLQFCVINDFVLLISSLPNKIAKQGGNVKLLQYYTSIYMYAKIAGVLEFPLPLS